jgi:pimeloyl-ACP methyl ester carboxylesterase
MADRFANCNGLQLAYDEFGDPQAPVILLIMGLGTQMIAWPEEFCEALAARGYRVIRFDNRDIGLSQKMGDAGVPSIIKLAALAKLKLPLRVPYTLLDMAKDTVDLMETLDISAAHIVGASMGGMIAQLVAAHYPFRVLSLTSIMSTSGHRSLPGAKAGVSLHMVKRPRNADAAALQDYSVRTFRLIGSPGFPPSEKALRDKIARSYERSYHPAGYARQMAAIMASGDRVSDLKKIIAPTLVIHGNADPLVPVEGGIDTARHVANATLEIIEGMGHDLPKELLPRFAQLIGDHCDTALRKDEAKTA